MRSKIALRRQTQQVSARAIGQRSDQPRIMVGQKRAMALESDIIALPVDVSQYIDMQVLDVVSSDYGKRYAIPDYDPPDDINTVVR